MEKINKYYLLCGVAVKTAPIINNITPNIRAVFNNHLIDTISMLEELDETEGETIVTEV